MRSNKKIHKTAIPAIISLVLAITLLTSCSCDGVLNAVTKVAEKIGNAAEERNEKNGKISPTKYAVQTFNEVLELVEAKDSQAIFDMFSEYNRENIDLMPEIEKLVNFLDGKIVEMRHVGASSDYCSVRDGVTVSSCYSADTYVTTDRGTLYWFRVGVITADEDETKLGLDWIYVLDSNAKTAFRDEWRYWYDNNRNQSPEPQRPDDLEVGVNY